MQNLLEPLLPPGGSIEIADVFYGSPHRASSNTKRWHHSSTTITEEKARGIWEGWMEY
ncbi:hypothetical protein Vi05172_g9593 [Venturia inaequalis]|nr:hypothetical protein Vi05172_g9593 [Venturia inaequalis]